MLWLLLMCGLPLLHTSLSTPVSLRACLTSLFLCLFPLGGFIYSHSSILCLATEDPLSILLLWTLPFLKKPPALLLSAFVIYLF